jgi:preprotein translocase subunit SecG
MQIWSNLLVVLQILSAVIMIGLVLLQHGKGADMGASFGSGASGSLFGATGSANFLSRSTAVCATVFFAATLALSVIATHRGTFTAPVPSSSTSNRLDAALSAPSAPVAASDAASAVAVPAAASSTPAAAASVAASAAPTIPTK